MIKNLYIYKKIGIKDDIKKPKAKRNKKMD